MRRHSVSAALVVCLALGTLLCPMSSHAAEPYPVEPLLAPTSGGENVEIVGLALEKTIRCDATPCQIATTQTWRLHNRDTAQPHHLVMGLSAATDQSDGALPALSDDQGEMLVSVVSASGEPAWELDLAANGYVQLKLAYTSQVTNAGLIRWEMDPDALSQWAALESLRLTWVLPEYHSEDIFWSIEPSNYAFDGVQLVWEYESPNALAMHRLVALSPTLHTQLDELRRTNQWPALADQLEILGQSAATLDLPVTGIQSEALAARYIAARQSSDDGAARLELARALNSQAQAKPDDSLNLLVLSARELEQVLERRPEDAEARTMLGEVYQQIIQVSSESNDAEGALLYLRKAQELGQNTINAATFRDLTLHWGLALAERGQVAEALAQIGDQLSPQWTEEMLHYAPSFSSAHTQVWQSATQRVVTYTLALYAPSARETTQRLETLASLIQEQTGWQVQTGADAEQATLSIRRTSPISESWSAETARLQEALGNEPDLLVDLVLAPWQTEIRTRRVLSTPWYNSFSYNEWVDLTPLQQAWDEQADYVRWRLVEIRAGTGTVPWSETERDLAILVLRDQEQTWGQLPASTYWTFEAVADELPERPSSAWLVRWGQIRELAFQQPHYNPLVIGISILALILIAVVTTSLAWWQAQR